MGAAINTGSKKKGATPDINVTPLVDVALVLLIIMMVATPAMDKNVPVDLPEVINTDPKSKNKMNPIEVTVDKEGAITIEKKPFDLVTLEAELRAMHAAEPERQITIRAHKTLDFVKVRDVLAVVQKINFDGTAFAVNRPDTSRGGKDEGDI